MSTYPYKPLDTETETRVLEIEPGNYDDEIVCSLKHISLLTNPKFEALSYCWGNSMSCSPDEETLDKKAKVVVLDGETNKTIIEELVYRDLENHPQYQQTYYFSGGPRKPGKIHCDGIDIMVGGELYSILKRLRPLPGSNLLVIWVDAVCINQFDLEERKLHVGNMSKIYENAEIVRIWLGEEVGNSTQAFETLKEVAEKMAELSNDKKLGGFERQGQFLHDQKIRGLHWDSLSELLDRSWFERVWVIQEIAKAAKATIHCGKIVWDWDIFALIINTMRIWDIDIFLWAAGEPKAIEAIRLMHRLRSPRENPASTPSPKLLETLQDSRKFKCTFPSDKIYGILGLVSDPECVEVDYSISPSEVFKRYTISYLKNHNSLDILYYCAKPKKKSELNLPSWVADWTQSCHHEPFVFLKLPCRAAGKSKIDISFSNDYKSLHTRGKVLDSIEEVEQFRKIPRNSEMFYEEGQPFFQSRHVAWIEHNHREVSRKWVLNVLEVAFPNRVATPESFEALWRAFICNRTQEGDIPSADWGEHFYRWVMSMTYDMSETDALKEEWKSETRITYDLTEKASSEDPYEKSARMMTLYFNKAFGMWCYNRRFFRSKAGRFGWATDTAMAGDEICIFYGGDAPFVLRPGGRGRHEIIGDGYIHGFMDGEAMGADIEERDFHLI